MIQLRPYQAEFNAGARLYAGFASSPGGTYDVRRRQEFIDALHNLANAFSRDFCETLLKADVVGGVA